MSRGNILSCLSFGEEKDIYLCVFIGMVTDLWVDYRSLKRELVRAQEEIKRIQSVPLVIGQFMEAIDQK